MSSDDTRVMIYDLNIAAVRVVLWMSVALSVCCSPGLNDLEQLSVPSGCCFGRPEDEDLSVCWMLPQSSEILL